MAGNTSVRAVRFADRELVVVTPAVERSGLKFNAWVRRACVRQAELEAALEVEDASAVAIVPPLPEGSGGRPFTAAPLLERAGFRPDFGKRLKP